MESLHVAVERKEITSVGIGVECESVRLGLAPAMP